MVFTQKSTVRCCHYTNTQDWTHTTPSMVQRSTSRVKKDIIGNLGSTSLNLSVRRVANGPRFQTHVTVSSVKGKQRVRIQKITSYRTRDSSHWIMNHPLPLSHFVTFPHYKFSSTPRLSDYFSFASRCKLQCRHVRGSGDTTGMQMRVKG